MCVSQGHLSALSVEFFPFKKLLQCDSHYDVRVGCSNLYKKKWLVIGGLWFSSQMNEFGIAIGDEWEELEYQRQVQFIKFSSDCS